VKGGREAFEEFFRASYQPLLRDVIFAGGNPHEAEDALAAAMIEVLQRWDTIENPRAYARRAAISNLIKSKQRGLPRIRERLIQRGNVQLEHHLDPGLAAWEQQEWVKLLLKALPRAQREVVACMIDTYTLQEIAQMLGKTEATVRQNLCAARKRLRSYLAETGTDAGSTTSRKGDR
jgi:RNA polymerase sigma factor (sigma-70 family)